MTKPNKKVLFICLGNICRSPAAHGILEHIAGSELEVESAGTSAYHAGEKADARMRKAASERGISLNSISRGFKIKDFEHYDLIITMDDSNYFNITNLDYQNEFKSKIFKMTSFLSEKYSDVKEIPDPYYGGSQGFEFVLDLLEDACKNLLDKIKKGEL